MKQFELKYWINIFWYNQNPSAGKIYNLIQDLKYQNLKNREHQNLNVFMTTGHANVLDIKNCKQQFD